MAGQRPAEGCVRQGALRRVRLRQQRLGRDLSIRAAHDRRATGGAWRAQPLCPRRGRCPQRSRRPVRKMVRGGRARGDEGIRRRFQLRPQRRRRAAVFDRAGGAVRRQRDRRAGRRRADEGARSIPNCRTRPAPMLPTARPGISRCNCRPASPTASAIISASCRATIRRWSIPSRAVSASCRPIRSGCRSPKAAARNCRSAMPYRSGGC